MADTRMDRRPLRTCLTCGNVWSRENIRFREAGTCPSCSGIHVVALDEAPSDPDGTT